METLQHLYYVLEHLLDYNYVHGTKRRGWWVGPAAATYVRTRTGQDYSSSHLNNKIVSTSQRTTTAEFGERKVFIHLDHVADEFVTEKSLRYRVLERPQDVCQHVRDNIIRGSEDEYCFTRNQSSTMTYVFCLVPTLCGAWPILRWAERVRVWPTRVDNVPDKCIVFVNTDHSTDTYVSFNQTRQHLLCQLPEKNRRVLTAFSIITGGRSDTDSGECCDVSETVLLWYCERHGVEWDDDMLVITHLINNLQNACRTGFLPHYFLEEVNILPDRDSVREIQQRLEKFSENPTGEMEKLIIVYPEAICILRWKIQVEKVMELAFRAYGKHKQVCHRDEHHDLHETSFIRNKHPQLRHIVVPDQSAHHSITSLILFKMADKMTEQEKKLKVEPLSALCWRIVVNLKRATCSDLVTEGLWPMKTNTEDTELTLDVLHLESRLAQLGILIYLGDFESAMTTKQQLMEIIGTVAISNDTMSTILVEEARVYIYTGSPLQAQISLHKALELNEKNQDAIWYFFLMHYSDKPERVVTVMINWLQNEDEHCGKFIYLIYLTEHDLQLLEQIPDVRDELRYLMGIEDSGKLYLKDHQDPGCGIISRVPFAARSLFCYFLMSFLTRKHCVTMNKQRDILVQKCMNIMKTTATKSSRNIKYQSWALLGYSTLEEDAAYQCFSNAKKCLDNKASVRMKKRMAEYSARSAHQHHTGGIYTPEL